MKTRIISAIVMLLALKMNLWYIDRDVWRKYYIYNCDYMNKCGILVFKE